MNFVEKKIFAFSQYTLYLILCTFFFSCKVHYSMTGATISPDIKTFNVRYFNNSAPLVQPTLSQVFTEKLKDKFLAQTSLKLSDQNPDLIFEGSITGYSTQPIAIQSNETAGQTRLTITVNVKYTDTKDEKQNFETTFSRYADFDSRQSLTAVENELIKQITDQLADDIFNKAFVNW